MIEVCSEAKVVHLFSSLARGKGAPSIAKISKIKRRNIFNSNKNLVQYFHKKIIEEV